MILPKESRELLDKQASNMLKAYKDFTYVSAAKIEWWEYFIFMFLVVTPITQFLQYLIMPIIKYYEIIEWYNDGDGGDYYNVYLAAYYNYFYMLYSLGINFVGFCQQLDETTQFFLNYFIFFVVGDWNRAPPVSLSRNTPIF